MLLSFTLNTAEDGPDEAATAIRTIARQYGLSVLISNEAPGAPTAPGDAPIDPATVGFGGAPNAAANAGIGLPPPDPETAALLARVETDTDGLPWDNRIHAPSKAKNADGRWKAKSKVTAEERTRVENELRLIMGVPAPTQTPPPAAAPTPPAVPPAPPPPQTPPPPAAPPPAVAAGPATFAELMAWLGPYLASGQLTPASVSEGMKALGVVDANGIGSVQLLAMRPDLIGHAYTDLCNRIPR